MSHPNTNRAKFNEVKEVKEKDCRLILVPCRFTEDDFEWIKNQAKRRKVSFACIVRESVKLGRQWELNRWI